MARGTAGQDYLLVERLFLLLLLGHRTVVHLWDELGWIRAKEQRCRILGLFDVQVLGAVLGSVWASCWGLLAGEVSHLLVVKVVGLVPAPCHAYVLVWLVGIHSWCVRSSTSFSLRNYLALLLRESSFTCLLWLGRTGLGLQDLGAYALQVMFIFVTLIPLLFLEILTLWLYWLLISFTETRSLLWEIICLKAIF